MQALATALAAKIEREAKDLDSATRGRIEAAIRGIERRLNGQVLAWRGMLRGLAEDTPAQFVDWFEVERADGHDRDVAFQRRWLDPTEPLAATVLRPAQGALITSATLTDGGDDPQAAWAVATARSGAAHLPDATRASVPSPFDYPAQTRVFVVTDLGRDDPARVASAVRAHPRARLPGHRWEPQPASRPAPGRCATLADYDPSPSGRRAWATYTSGDRTRTPRTNRRRMASRSTATSPPIVAARSRHRT
jgi:hypothetical protein